VTQSTHRARLCGVFFCTKNEHKRVRLFSSNLP
jgi:hypothetical protein